jgi:hypothetical protein
MGLILELGEEGLEVVEGVVLKVLAEADEGVLEQFEGRGVPPLPSLSVSVMESCLSAR